MDYDVIIIGSGLGGLTAGATLAKKGKKVIVLEQHYLQGGCATVFMRNGIRHEVGLHEMDWGTPDRDMKALIFKKLGILDTLPLVKTPQVWRIKTETSEYTIPDGRENVIEYLGEKFPQEKKNIKRYFFKMKFSSTIARKLPHDLSFLEFFIFPIRTLPTLIYDVIKKANVGNEMDNIFKSNRLRNILNANLSYYTNNAYDLSWHYYSCAQYSYYNSAVFVKGGSQVLSDTLADVIKNNGGEVRLMSDVKRIDLDKNKAVGVTYYDKKAKQEVTLTAKKIIANIDPANIFEGNMVPGSFAEKATKGKKPSSSLYSVYITFKKAPSKIYKDMAYSTFISSDNLLDGTQRQVTNDYIEQDVKKRSFVFVDYSTIDSGLVKPGDERSFGVFCSSSNLSEWKNLSDQEYKDKKEGLAKALFARLEIHYPGISDMVEHYEVSTPKTVKRYIRTSNGTAYGYINDGYALFDRVPCRSKAIKNLHYAGAFTFPGGGFTGAIISGYYTASDMLFPMKYRIIYRTILCTVVGTAVGMGITELIHLFF